VKKITMLYREPRELENLENQYYFQIGRLEKLESQLLEY